MTKQPARRNPLKRKPHPRSTREANAEHLLLQALALRIGQEAARQNGINHTPTTPLGDHTGATLATLDGIGDKPVTLEVTLKVIVNPTTSAAIGTTPPTRP